MTSPSRPRKGRRSGTVVHAQALTERTGQCFIGFKRV